jgi:hypothetical protein
MWLGSNPLRVLALLWWQLGILLENLMHFVDNISMLLTSKILLFQSMEMFPAFQFGWLALSTF